MDIQSKIFVAGHRGLVGSAILRQLQARGYTNLITADRKQLDLTRQQAVEDFFTQQQPEVVVLAAAKVGGILANRDFKADFIVENLLIQTHVIAAAHRIGVKKLLFLGSSCIYPKLCPQPMKEEYLLTGLLEPTNDAYAVAKIAGIKMCQSYNEQHGTNYLSAMPTNLYGPGDNFDLNSSHVLPAMLRKFHEAKLAGNQPVILWGSGTPKREFLFVEDMAEACLFLLEKVQAGDAPGDLYNLGTGVDLSINDLAQLVQKTVGHRGDILWDRDKPDGTPRKLQEVSRLKGLGWQASTSLEDGLAQTYQWYLNQLD
ncbi:MAG: GDP-L-fucose synthase [bacterium]|nr:GDP-L-fucose synthase [bacterium]